MNKQEYLNALSHALKTNKVSDIEEIIAEYKQHFEFKLRDGFSESEVAARLEKPENIAQQFALGSTDKTRGRGIGILLPILLVLLDIFVAAFFIVLFAWAIVMGAVTLAFAALGICLIMEFNIAGLAPYMPYIGSLVFGIAFLALSVLAAIGTVYCFMYFKQLIKAYGRWHRNKLKSGNIYPPLPKHPEFGAKSRRSLRSIALISLAVFGICSITATLILFAAADFKPFWHAWNWFQ